MTLGWINHGFNVGFNKYQVLLKIVTMQMLKALL
jgi:hypothetical protein